MQDLVIYTDLLINDITTRYTLAVGDNTDAVE